MRTCIGLLALFSISFLLSAAAATAENLSYNFYDRLGELRLVGRDKDLYVEKLNGADSRKITNTPEILEKDAFFSKDGRYVVYMADESKDFGGGVVDIKFRYFFQLIDDKDTKRVEITEFEFRDFKKERIRGKEKG